MKRSALRRLLALVVLAATVFALSAAPAGASQYPYQYPYQYPNQNPYQYPYQYPYGSTGRGRFKDILDEKVSQAADVLYDLGVVNGTSPGLFTPEGRLTRAEMCKIAVEVLGLGEKVQGQMYRTIFTDVGGSHWARGYVNLAATTEITEGSRLMLGLGNGTFGPELEVTYQETATLVLRILGYGAEANQSWPYGAIETASQLGLDQGLGITAPSDPITRAQTVQLFYRMLTLKPKGEAEAYAGKLGKLVEDVIILSTDATINGQSGWVLGVQGGSTVTYPAAAPADATLLGRRGSVLLDKEGRFVTLLSDDSTSVTGALTQKQGNFLTLSGQGRYTLSESTPVYTGSAHDSAITTYGEYSANLRVGDALTLYLDGKGLVIGLFRGEASTETRFVVVRGATASYDTFRAITGGAYNYTIRKNGATVSMSAIKQYDVATYDPISKVLDVCDVRLSCIYENAYPAPTAPSRVTAAGGNEFDVLADAMVEFAGRRLGDAITLLFTSNGKVAGVLSSQYSWSGVSSNALGVVVAGENGKPQFELLGCKLVLKNGIPEDTPSWGLFNAYSNQWNVLSLQPMGGYGGGQFYPSNLVLNGTRVSPYVRIYERLSSGEMRARSLSELPASVYVTQYHVDSAGQIDLMILGSYSGDGVEYGRVDVLNGYRVERLPDPDPTPAPTAPGPDQGGDGSGGDGGSGPDKDEPKLPTYRRTTAQKIVVNGAPQDVPEGRYFYSGYAAVTVTGDGFMYANYLQGISNVPTSAFYTQDGVTYVQTSQGVYVVDDNVQCYNIAASYTPPSYPPYWVNSGMWENNEWTGEWPESWPAEWFPEAPNIVKFNTLNECRNFASTVNVYIDTTGQRVRVVEVP